MTRVLWVTAEVPDPDLTGGSIRQFHLLSALADRASVDLAVVGHVRHDPLRNRLHGVAELPVPPVRAQPAHRWRRRAADLWTALGARDSFEAAAARPSRRLLQPIVREASGYDIVNVEHGYLGPLLPPARSGRWIITFHNVDSARSEQHAAIAAGRRQAWLWTRDAARARRLERWTIGAYDRVIAVTPEDARRLGGRAIVVPNGIDLARFRPTPVPREPHLLFSAHLGYGPNVDAATWFCREVFPLVRAAVPDATLDLVGRHPVDAVRALQASPGVALHPDVASVDAYLQRARISVVPVRVGTGTRVKALEAMAAGRPLVGTTIGLEGLDLVDGESAAIADEPASMANAIVDLLHDDAGARRQAEAARATVGRFSWERITPRFVETVLELAGSPADVQDPPARG